MATALSDVELLACTAGEGAAETASAELVEGATLVKEAAFVVEAALVDETALAN